jgi:tetratricopeptide repeat protein 4
MADNLPPSLNALVDSLTVQDGSQAPPNGRPGAALPPQMAKTADEAAAELNRIPLFMTELDETDGEGGENIALEGLRALAYEGTRAEIAANFREHGNDCAKEKKWKDAKEYYDQALDALRRPQGVPQDENGLAIKLDEKEEAAKERVLKEACYVNRALCNLELSRYSSNCINSIRVIQIHLISFLRISGNFRLCQIDCADTLRMNPRNIKAWFRAASACLAVDRIDAAEDACRGGLEVDPSNPALKSLSSRIQSRKETLAQVSSARREREQRLAAEKATISAAFKLRRVPVRTSAQPPDTQDAMPTLADPLNPQSTLSLPVLLLYPLAAQSDLIKAFEETHSLADHLAYILPDMPWDTDRAYTPDIVECYIATPVGGVAKIGKKVTLKKVLESGKAEVVDGVLRVYVVPRSDAEKWINEFKVALKRERERGV